LTRQEDPMTTHSLPDGRSLSLPTPQARRVWQIWLGGSDA